MINSAKVVILAASALAVIGSSALSSERVTALDLGDAITTHIATNLPNVYEANDLMGVNPSVAAFVGKYIVRNYGGPVGKVAADISGALGTCNNIATIAGAMPHVSIPIGLACAALTQVDLPAHTPPTSCGYNEHMVAGRVCIED